MGFEPTEGVNPHALSRSATDTSAQIICLFQHVTDLFRSSASVHDPQRLRPQMRPCRSWSCRRCAAQEPVLLRWWYVGVAVLVLCLATYERRSGHPRDRVWQSRKDGRGSLIIAYLRNDVTTCWTWDLVYDPTLTSRGLDSTCGASTDSASSVTSPVQTADLSRATLALHSPQTHRPRAE